MIIVKLMGGLGNQMFQYAFGRQLSVIHNTPLKLDLSFLLDRTPREDFTYRDYELNAFNIKDAFATKDEIKPFFYKPSGKISKIIWEIKNRNPYKYIHETTFSFHANFLNSPKNSYVDGYWQSEKYFSGIEDTIRRDFTLRKPLSAPAQKIKKRILSENAVSIHIRRTDFVNSIAANKFHGVCSFDYYYQSIEYMLKNVKDGVFYVFSDDLEWVKKNLAIKGVHLWVEDNKAKQNYEDMYLMSLCKHHIIANSSFSWWGAWLCENKNKIVIAPQKWFNDQSVNDNDLIPDAWMKI